MTSSPCSQDSALIDVTTATDWRDYHRIRRTVLWDARGRRGYDEAHPDDVSPTNHPLLLKAGREAIGTVRLDEATDRTGIVRLVAIVPELQRMGYGRTLLQAVETYATRLRLTRLNVNAAPNAVGYYLKMGWTPRRFDDPDRQAVVGSVQFSKPLEDGPPA